MKNTKTEKEVGQLERLVNRSAHVGGHLRCSICNSVSNDSIETNIGDYKAHMSFTPDPKDTRHVICISCAEVIEDQHRDYEYMDDWKELMA